MAQVDKPFARLFSLLRIEKKQIIYIYTYAIFNGIIYLSIPLGVQAIINFLTGGQVSTSLVLLIVFVIMGLALSGWFQIMQLTLTENLQQRIFTNAAFEFAFRLPRVKLEALYKQYAPELMNRFFDTLSVQKGLAKLLIDFSTASLQIIFGLILLSFYHPFFIVFGLITVLVIYLIFRITGPNGLRSSLKESEAKYEVAHWLEEVARTLNTFKLAGNSNLPLDNTDVRVQKYLKHRKSHFKILVVQYINMVGFKLLIVGGLLILGSYLVLNAQINIGQFVASEIIIILIITSIEKLILSMETVYDVLTALEKIGIVTDLDLENEGGVQVITGEENKGMRVSMHNVTFQYPDTSKPVLSNINLEIEPGEKVCVAGANGSGKATLLQLMAGLYEDYQGNITYNDLPVSNLNLDSLRTAIGDSLFQEKLFKGSLAENITLGRKDISSQQVQAAIDLVGAQDLINNSREGINVHINPEGKHLAESTVVKLILARSIAGNPRLLLLSDNLGRIEKPGRERIISNLLDASRPWTLIIISNNLEIASRCDRVVVLEDGSIKQIIAKNSQMTQLLKNNLIFS
jgi:ABC-type bacteriocin/lantibiotic exporter with double-glycine peptidase domain